MGQETAHVPAEDQVYELSPFTVTETAFGYAADLSISASRVAVELRKLPRSLNVITSELLGDSLSMDVLDAIRFASSVDPSENDSGRLVIRGFDVNTRYRNFNPTRSYTWGPFIDRLEVVKGPASTLYGRASPGGLVNVVTKRPNFNKATDINSSFGVDGIDLTRVILDHQNSLEYANGIGYRIIGAWEDKDGPVDYTPEERYGILASIEGRLTSRDAIIFEYEYDYSEKWWGYTAPHWNWTDTATMSVEQTPWDFSDDNRHSLGLPFEYADEKTTKFFAEYRRRFFDTWNLSVVYEKDNDGLNDWSANFQDVPRYRSPDEDGEYFQRGNYNYKTGDIKYGFDVIETDIDADGLYANLTGQWDFWKIENRFLFGASSYDLINTTDTRTASENRVTRSGLLVNSQAFLNMTLDEARAFDILYELETEIDDNGDGANDFQWRFGQHEITRFKNVAYYATVNSAFFNDTLRILAGIRYDELQQYRYSERQVRTKDGDIIVENEDPWQKQNDATGQYAIMYDVFSFVSLYASYSESLVQQFGSVRERFFPPELADPAKPLTGTGAEIGLKFDLFDGIVSGTIAAFDLKETGRVRNIGTDTYGPYQSVTEEDITEGIEMDLILAPTPNWQTIIGVSYLDTEYFDADSQDPTFDSWERRQNVPLWQGNIWTRYSVDDGILKGWTVAGGATYKGDRSESYWPGPRRPVQTYAHLDEYLVWDAMVGYDWSSKTINWAFRLNIQNVTNEHYHPAGFEYGNPRNFIFSVKASF
ncbi:MAG: TonB-dependent siderophore receptor [Puniceicoccaceae bacterium]